MKTYDWIEFVPPWRWLLWENLEIPTRERDGRTFVYFSDENGRAWDAAVAACEARGVEIGSRRGYAIAHAHLHGGRDDDESWAPFWAGVERRDAEAARREEIRAQHEVDRAAFEALTDGYRKIGSTTLAQEPNWNWELVGELVEPIELRSRDIHGPAEVVRTYRVDAATLVVRVGSLAGYEYTRDHDKIADAERREAIGGYRYRPELVAPLVELDQDRPSGWLWTHFGGDYDAARVQETCIKKARLGAWNRTAAEKIVSLRADLQCVDHPAAVAALGALDLPDAIVEVSR